ncbi:MAG: hypothetical protein ACI9TH_002109 [Kiritimatiellia bacterium]|jgi:hypothetical protein
MDKKIFQTELASIEALMTKVMRSNPKPGEKLLTAMGIRRGSILWEGRPGCYQLDWGYSTKGKISGNLKFIVEYIKLTALPVGERSVAAAAQSANPRTLSELKAFVSSKPNGDIFIQGIPMVDQGDKGCCAVASAERIFKNYQLEALKKTGSKLGCRLSVIIDWKSDDFMDMLKDYNKLADKAGHDQVPYKTHVITAGYAFQTMHSDTLREMRLKGKRGYANFLKEIKEMVGKVEAKPPISGVGGHLRLIIGYNPATSELIYTDSLGYGHEYKRMSAEDAWMITMGMYAILPRA